MQSIEPFVEVRETKLLPELVDQLLNDVDYSTPDKVIPYNQPRNSIMENEKVQTTEDSKGLMITVYSFSGLVDGKPQYVHEEVIAYQDYKEKYHPLTHENPKNHYIWDLALNKGYTVSFASGDSFESSHVAITGPTMEKLGITIDPIVVTPMDSTVLYSMEGGTATFTDRQLAKTFEVPRAHIKRMLKGLQINDEPIKVIGITVAAVGYRDRFLRNVTVQQVKS